MRIVTQAYYGPCLDYTKCFHDHVDDDSDFLDQQTRSMSERKRTLAKLTVGSDDELYLLTTEIGEDGEEGFELALCDGVNGWTGSCMQQCLVLLFLKFYKMSVTH